MLGGAWARIGGGVTKLAVAEPQFFPARANCPTQRPTNAWLGMNDVSAERAVAEWGQKLRAVPLHAWSVGK